MQHMNYENIVQEWYGAVHEATDKALATLANPPAENTVAKVKANILLCEYLCDALEFRAGRAEGFERSEAIALNKGIHSKIIEDAVAGIWSQEESQEITLFLYLCIENRHSVALSKPMFTELLQRALNADITAEAGALVMETADRVLDRFAEQRKVLRAVEE
jgi:hypothetical protein